MKRPLRRTLYAISVSIGFALHVSADDARAQSPVPAESRVPAAPSRTVHFDRQRIAAKELFALDSAALKPQQRKLDQIAVELVTQPQIGRVRVIGYTDRLGTREHNLKLSQRRAEAVRDYLVSKGVKPNRLIAIGKGASDPVVECTKVKPQHLIRCLEPNRRVELQQVMVEEHRH